MILTAFAAAVAVSLGASPADTAVPLQEGRFLGDRIGVATSTVWLEPSIGYRYLRQARDGGITWAREDFAWSAIEPQPGRFAWSRTDALMRNAARLGMNVLALATYAPGWATGHQDSDKYPPTDPGSFAAFVGAIAARYGSGGTFWKVNPHLPVVPLTAIEIWNEPWHPYFWRPVPDAGAYARLVRATATAVKARHPEMTILASGDVSQQGWLEELLRADPGLWRSNLVNAWSVHLYCQQRSPTDTTVDPSSRFDRILVTRSLAQAAGADKPIWITEFGWSTNSSYPDAVSEETQADYERQALARATTEWQSFVPRSFVFTLTEPSRDDRYNLLRPDGTPRPAWEAIKAFISSGT